MGINSSLVLNVTTLTYLSDGENIITEGNTLFYAQSDYANLLLVDIRDGGATNSTTLINFKPKIKNSYTSHWFYMKPEGIVEKNIDGQVKSFYRYSIRIPHIVLNNNDVRDVVENQITVQRRLGTNHIGNFATLALLRDVNATQKMFDDKSVAYVIEELNKGYYQLTEVTSGVFDWEKVENISTLLQRKQYSLGEIKVSAGYSTDMDIPKIEDETLFVFMDILSGLSVQVSATDEKVNELEERIVELETALEEITNLLGIQ